MVFCECQEMPKVAINQVKESQILIDAINVEKFTRESEQHKVEIIIKIFKLLIFSR